MLHMLENTRKKPISSHENEFQSALSAHKEQVFNLIPQNVNEALKSNEAFAQFDHPYLTQSQLWQGEKDKGKMPHIYTNPIVVSAVVESTLEKTSYGERYDRISIQPSWITGNLVIVREETHANDLTQRMTFLGRPVDLKQAKNLLLPRIIDEIYRQNSEKAKRLLPFEMDQASAVEYLNQHFEEMFSIESPALFHVQHGVAGDEENPQELWTLVRLAPAPDEKEKAIVDKLREKIENSPSIKLYLETLKALEKPSNKLKN